MFVKILLLLILSASAIKSAKILGIFYAPSLSHQIVFQPIWKGLALRGHEVTVITPNILNDTSIKNLNEIDVGFSYDVLRKSDVEKNFNINNYKFNNVKFFFSFFEKVIVEDLKDPKVQKLINDKSKQFDLVLVESLHPLVYGFASRFNAPIIGVSSLGALLHTYDSIGNPTHPVITPDLLLNLIGKPTFQDRLQSVLYNIWFRIYYYGYYLPKANLVARKYFGNDIPYLGDLEKNVSLLLLNINPILHPIRANVPGIIELTQMHIKAKNPLPTDLKKFLDESTEGVIYFSLGTNVISSNLAEKVLQVIISALSELPYKVLWKWESDNFPNQPKNVITRKWLPQQDVLGHPNIKAFVTQGGLQSMEEAVSNGIPIIGMPFIADQPSNVMKMIDLGIAQGVDYHTMIKDDLKSTIIEVATNEKYRENVRKIKDLLVDQPMGGLEKAMWWIEYVIRHKGAAHLRSPAVDMPWYQYFLLDVFAFVLIAMIILVYVIYFVISYFVTKSNNKIKIQ